MSLLVQFKDTITYHFILQCFIMVTQLPYFSRVFFRVQMMFEEGQECKLILQHFLVSPSVSGLLTVHHLSVRLHPVRLNSYLCRHLRFGTLAVHCAMDQLPAGHLFPPRKEIIGPLWFRCKKSQVCEVWAVWFCCCLVCAQALVKHTILPAVGVCASGSEQRSQSP